MGCGPTQRVSRLVVTRTAKTDIRSIWRYIAEDSPRHADLVEEAIYETCYAVAKTPGMGHPRPEITSRNVLFLSVSGYDRYVVVYASERNSVKVLRVLHGARNLQSLIR